VLKKNVFIIGLLILLFCSNSFAQTINNNRAVISITGGTVLGVDSIINSSAATFQNNGTVSLANINNSGSISGNGNYNISNVFSNSGLFSNGTSTVNFNGTSAQTITALNYYNLTTSNARGANNITYSSAATIGIAGSFNPNASFTSGSNIITGTNFDFNGSGAQSIPSFTFENVNFSGGNTKTLVGHLTLKNSMAIGANTTLALANYNITLKSDVTSTARVATSALTAAVTYGTGRFISERYIPGRRKYRLLTSPVTTSELTTLSAGQESLSIWGNWQNGGNNTTANVGTIITGGTVADGFDQHTSTPSVYLYQDTGHRYVAYGSITAKNTKYTPLKAGVAYYFFVYGDRTNSVSTNTPNYTTLKATGKILTGDQTYTTSSSQPLTNKVGDYTFLGNPFASPIDWTTITRTNLENTYWGWDPNLNTTGGYVTVNSSGGVTLISPFSGSVGLNQYIQSGQGFFVRTAASNPQLIIKETDKVSNYNVNAFRGPKDASLMAINLFYKKDEELVLADGAVVAFDSSFSNVKGKEDATKIFTSGEGVAIKNNSDLLSIDGRKLPEIDDTIAIFSNRLTKAQYSLQVYIQNFETSNLQPFLEDKYLNSLQALSISDTNWINFNVIANDVASANQNRFKIVFKSRNDLPGIITNIAAKKIERKIQIDFSVENEKNVSNYELQKSSNGIEFTLLSTISPKGNATNQDYQYIDEKPFAGKNYYRVKLLSNNNINLLSKVAVVEMDEAKGSINIFPNPIVGKSFIVNLKELNAGDYDVQIINSLGAVVEKHTVKHTGSNNNYNITLNNIISSGTYVVRVVNESTRLTQKIIINN
jgi:hypothetical protein